MADYTITAADVQYSGAVASIIAGEALDAGQIIYQDATDHLAYKAQCDGVAGEENVLGMTVNSAVAGQPVSYVGAAEIEVGTVFASAGKLLILSGVAGKMCDAGDIAGGDYLVVLGWSTATDSFQLDVKRTGFQL